MTEMKPKPPPPRQPIVRKPKQRAATSSQPPQLLPRHTKVIVLPNHTTLKAVWPHAGEGNDTASAARRFRRPHASRRAALQDSAEGASRSAGARGAQRLALRWQGAQALL